MLMLLRRCVVFCFLEHELVFAGHISYVGNMLGCNLVHVNLTKSASDLLKVRQRVRCFYLKIIVEQYQLALQHDQAVGLLISKRNIFGR